MRLVANTLLFISFISSLATASPLSNSPSGNNTNEISHILFHEDFENGWGKWAFPSSDTRFLSLLTKNDLAHSGQRFLRSEVTKDDLSIRPYISSKTRYIFKEPADEIYWRFYTRLNSNSTTPHHWVKLAATNGIFDVRGKAGVKPDGDEAIWFDIDIKHNDLLSFYVYWHEMRSGRCNDGSVITGCEGDQGETYYIGNSFRPANQTPLKRDEWICIEIHAKLNDIGKSNGELSLWINDNAVGDYKTGSPTGTWLRSQFHSDGCKFNACTEPAPFSGFSFRTSEKVKFREFYMDAYYQLNTFNKKSNRLTKTGIKVSEEQIIDYDDIVVATQRIGCMTDTIEPAFTKKRN